MAELTLEDALYVVTEEGGDLVVDGMQVPAKSDEFRQAVALLRRHLEPQWTEETPAVPGMYWWTPFQDEEPNLVSFNGCLKDSRGIHISRYGGYWLKLVRPPLPAPANQHAGQGEWE